jgi:hypothetical protein
VSAPLYPAEELYEGKDLPPDDVIMGAFPNETIGNILGKIAGDPCHEVYFWPLPGASVQKKTFCRLDNNFWVYSPNHEGGIGLVFVHTPDSGE